MMMPARTLDELQQAALSVVSELTLDRALQQIADAALKVVNARYAAIGIPDATGQRLSSFITSGMSQAEQARLARAPEGHGLLGAVLATDAPLIVNAIARHPDSVGFPDGHPPMHAFLGVPIVAHDGVLGTLYLADKLDGEFTSRDAQLLETLAAYAAAAIRNARLYDMSLTRQETLAARNHELAMLNAVSHAINAAYNLDQLLDRTLAQLIHLIGADAGEIHLREAGSDALVLALHHGAAVPQFWREARLLPAQAGPPQALAARQALTLDGVEITELDEVAHPGLLAAGAGCLMLLPIAARQRVVAVVSLLCLNGTPQAVPQPSVLSAIATQLGLAIEHAWLTEKDKQLAVLAERDRIAMDMHDGVLQSLNVVNLTLDYCQTLLDAGRTDAVRRNMHDAIFGVESAAQDIRAYIANLRPARADHATLRAALEAIVAEFRRYTSVSITLELCDAVPDDLPDEVLLAVLHICQEALTNVARHAAASAVTLMVRYAAGDLEVSLRDDGRGFDASQVGQGGYGLGNMRARALQIGGSLAMVSHPGKGTQMMLRVPLMPGV